MRQLRNCISSILALAASAAAQNVLINFDNIPGMPNGSGQIVPAASRLSTQLASTLGVQFTSPGGFVAIVNHGAPTPSVPNIFGGATTAGALSYTQLITISFVDPAHPSAPATTDFVQIRGDKSAVSGTATMKAYSASGVLLASNTVADSSAGLTLPIAVPGIQRIELTQTSGTIGYDDLQFHSVTPCSAPTSYCTAGTSTHGCNASVSGVGTPSASAASGFVLTASGVEGQKQGLFFYGLSGPAAIAWGTGTSFLCVKSPTQRTSASNSGGTNAACDGVITLDWNAFRAANPGALGSPFAGGEVVNAQCWFRDPPAAKTTSLTNGIEFTLCP